MKTLILDFIGVIADIDYKKMLSSMTLKQKFSALRIYASRKKFPVINYVFDAYQQGFINIKTLEELIKKDLPNSAYVMPLIFKNLQNNIIVNQNVLTKALKLKSCGVQLLLMSNSTPETEYVMEDHNLQDIFDGLILSTQIGYMKPQKNIYEHAISKYNLDVDQTVMIDDRAKNLKGARECGISTIRCKNSRETCEVLNSFIDDLKIEHQY